MPKKKMAKKQNNKTPKKQRAAPLKASTKRRASASPRKAHAGAREVRAKVPVIDPASPTLTGWPAIAHFLGQPIAVAQRWAKDGMPVERKGRYMTASREDLSRWLGREAGSRQPVHIPQTTDTDLIADLRRGLKELRSSRKN